ncbi:cell wall anchor protein [Lactiplantibacillus sp. DA1]|uniref:mucin-binding protein n=1 Tax=Lactiplantibacillus sp. DA1 TaxID=3079857 RepID=UPI00292A631E|nr:cell wall anchor protein [Lactiplantibacillus sp. DA1]MDV0430433.1 cell wall anchor protein [Lactiplantibacillus sp. DA1]
MMQYSRGNQRVHKPTIWLFSSVLILGWGLAPTAVQASHIDTTAMAKQSVSDHSGKAVVRETSVSTASGSMDPEQRQATSAISAANSSIASEGPLSQAMPVTSGITSSSDNRQGPTSQLERASNTASQVQPDSVKSQSATSVRAMTVTPNAHATAEGTRVSSPVTRVAKESTLKRHLSASSTNAYAVKANDEIGVKSQAAVQVPSVIPTMKKAQVMQRAVMASSFLTTAKNLSNQDYLDQYVKQYGQPALIAMIQDWLATYRIISLTGITIVNSSFDGSVAAISGGLHVINTNATIRAGQDTEWATIVNGGLSVTNNTITFTTKNALTDRSLTNQEMDYAEARPTGNGAIKGVPTDNLTVDDTMVDPREFHRAQINVSNFYNRLVTTEAVFPAANGGILSKNVIGEQGTADLGVFQGRHYYAVNLDLNDWHSGIRTIGFTATDVVIYNVVTTAPQLTIGGGFTSSTPNLVWNFNQATRIMNTTAITGKMVAPHAVLTTNQNVDAAAVLQYGFGDGNSAVWQTITSQNEHNYGFGQLVGDNPLAYLIAVIKSDGTVVDTLTGFQELLAMGVLKVAITDTNGNQLSGLKAINTHIAGQHRYQVTYTDGTRSATTWLNVLPAQEPVATVESVPEYRAVTRTIQYQDERTGAVVAAPVKQLVRFTRHVILNSQTKTVLGYDTNGDGVVDTTDGALAWQFVEPENSEWCAVVSPDLTAQGYQVPDLVVVQAKKVAGNGSDLTVIVKYKQITHVQMTQHEIIRTINYMDGETLRPIVTLTPVIQKVIYELLTVVAHDGTVLGYDTDGDGQVDTHDPKQSWLLVGSAPWFTAVKSPDLSGADYAAPDLKVVPRQMVTSADSENVTINVYYRLATQAITEYKNKRRITTYLDRQSHQTIAPAVQQLVVYRRTAIVEKRTGSLLGYDLNGDGKVDTGLANQAWVLEGTGQYTTVRSPDLTANGYTVPDIDAVTSKNVAVTDPDLETIVVTYGHRLMTITPDQPGMPGVPINPNNPIIVYPDISGQDDLTHAVRRTINYVYTDGRLAAPSVSQTVYFQRNATIDLVTGQVTYEKWMPVTTATMAKVISPVIVNATTMLTEVAAQTVSLTTGNQVVTVSYQRAPVSPNQPAGKPGQPDNHNDQSNQPAGKPGQPDNHNDQSNQPAGKPGQPDNHNDQSNQPAGKPDQPDNHNDQSNQPDQSGNWPSQVDDHVSRSNIPADPSHQSAVPIKLGQHQQITEQNQVDTITTVKAQPTKGARSTSQVTPKPALTNTSVIGWVSAQPAKNKTTRQQNQMSTLPQTSERHNHLSIWGIIVLVLSSIVSWFKIKQRD